MKDFVHNFLRKHHFNKSLLFSLSVIFAILLFASCKTEAEFDGDILEVINTETSSTISFKKDKDSPVAFVKSYKIGIDYTAADLPGNNNAEVDALNPGFDLVGWALEEEDTDLQKIFTYDEQGCIKTFHMGVRSITLYGAKYTAATDTPYKIIYKTQNLTMDGYEDYSDVTLEGTTSTPDAPSYTDAANNLIEIPGFSPRLDLITEVEILADGSAVVEVFYDRNSYTLTFHANDGSGDAEQTETQTFYYGVTAQLKPNSFTRDGCGFAGWATTRERAAAGTVDYTDGANYTISIGDADLYAVWTLPHISITIELPGADEVGVTYEIDAADPNKVTFSAVIPVGHTEDEYSFSWFFTNEGFANVQSTSSSWEVDTTGWAPGFYQISLIAIHIADSMPSGGTVQIEVQ